MGQQRALFDDGDQDLLTPEPGAFSLLDRGYTDFDRLHALPAAGSFFVIRAKRNLRFKRRYSQPVDRIGTKILCDRTGMLEIYYSKQGYPSRRRRPSPSAPRRSARWRTAGGPCRSGAAPDRHRAARAALRCIGQRVAHHRRAKPQVVQPSPLCLHTRFDIAQRLAKGQLREGHRIELV